MAYSNPVPSVVKSLEIAKVTRSSSLKLVDVKGNLYKSEKSPKESSFLNWRPIAQNPP